MCIRDSAWSVPGDNLDARGPDPGKPDPVALDLGGPDSARGGVHSNISDIPGRNEVEASGLQLSHDPPLHTG
eukprot:3786708-Alexandrium_andersonii.AAC.1